METLDNALVVGNGESRKDFDIKSFSIPVFGCNALHRDFIPEHLICCDRRMADEAISNPQTKNCQIYVRHNWYNYFRKIKKNKNIKLLPDLPFNRKYKADEPFHWGSGPYALLLACELDYKIIHIVGFDLYPWGSTVNNIYKDSPNYASSVDRPIDPSYWIYQIDNIISHYKEKKFIFYNVDSWAPPKVWIKENTDIRNISNFKLDIK